MKQKECILLFARTPQLGKGKTRLAKNLGLNLTLLVYENMLQALADRLSGLPYYVVYQNENKDREALDSLKQIFNSAKGFQPQVSGDLGCKMQSASQRFLEDGYQKVILLGSDTPHVSKSEIKGVFETLDNKDFVIGPATDGGYWLLAMKNKVSPQIFQDMEWGGKAVFFKTYQRLLESQNLVELISKKIDLDTLEDFQKIMQEYPDLFDKGLRVQIENL